MGIYVLVGGAWIGAWAWKHTARELRRRGHEVYPLSLTGLGERVHLARPEVDLETHIADVVNLIEIEDLHDVILVGHSYAAIVITGAADRRPGRLAHLVYLDSAPLEEGESMLDLYPPEASARLEERVAREGEGWRLPFPSFEELATTSSLDGLGPAERALMRARTAAQSFRTYTEPLRLTRAGEGAYGRWIIACNDFQALLAAGIPRLRQFAPPAWGVLTLATGHWPMLSAPRALAALLDEIGRARQAERAAGGEPVVADPPPAG